MLACCPRLTNAIQQTTCVRAKQQSQNRDVHTYAAGVPCSGTEHAKQIFVAPRMATPRHFCGNAMACLSLATPMNLHEKHLFACYADNYSEKGNTIGSALQGSQNWGITYMLPWRCFWRGPGGTVEMDAQDESCLPRGLGPHPAKRQELMYQKRQVCFTAHTDFLPRAPSAAHCDCALLRNAHA